MTTHWLRAGRLEGEEEEMKQVFRSICIAGLSVILSMHLCAQDQTASVRGLLGSLVLGSPTRFENITLIPLSLPKAGGSLPYITLDEALRQKLLEITEIDGGTVPQVAIGNKSDKIIFIMGGEIITGGKQDRVVGGDVLIGPKTKRITVPVFCVEAGRWTYTTPAFTTRENLGTWTIREKALKKEPTSQGGIWNEVGKIANSTSTSSDTSALQDVYADGDVSRRIEEVEKKLRDVPRLAPGTLGIACGVGGKIVSVDVFSDPALFAKLWPKILRSAALSAVSEEAKGSVTREQAADFLQRLSDARFVQSGGAGIKAAAEGMTIGALGYKGVAVHVVAFPRTGEE
jgi:hypothetical protein